MPACQGRPEFEVGARRCCVADARRSSINSERRPISSRNTVQASGEPSKGCGDHGRVAISPSVVTPPPSDSFKPAAVSAALWATCSASCSRSESPTLRRCATTSRIQSGSAIPGRPRGCSRPLNSRCVWALTRPGKIAALPRSIASAPAVREADSRLRRRCGRLRSQPRRRRPEDHLRERRSVRTRRATGSGVVFVTRRAFHGNTRVRRENDSRPLGSNPGHGQNSHTPICPSHSSTSTRRRSGRAVVRAARAVRNRPPMY